MAGLGASGTGGDSGSEDLTSIGHLGGIQMLGQGKGVERCQRGGMAR